MIKKYIKIQHMRTEQNWSPIPKSDASVPSLQPLQMCASTSTMDSDRLHTYTNLNVTVYHILIQIQI
jgi:hypothetical protein